MVINGKDYDLFIKAAKRHNLRPLAREISSIINGKSVILYEIIGMDKVTEYIIEKEMEEIQNEN